MTGCELFGHSYHEVTGECGYCPATIPMPTGRRGPLMTAADYGRPRLPEVIRVRYSTIDRFSESRRFVTLAGARRYARRRLGDSFDIGSDYAVSADGVGKLTANIPITVLMDSEG